MRYTAQESPAAVVLTPNARVNAAVIWLHGLGDSGYGFAPIVPELSLPDTLAIRFTFPHAPQRAVTLNNGYVMPAWYDIAGSGPDREEDAAGIRESDATVRSYIEREVSNGIAASRIVIAGFSQGGAITFQTGLRYPQRLAGLMALSTYLPLAASVKAEMSDANRDVPILMCHGTRDPMIAASRAAASRDALLALGYQIEWRTYPMEHNVCAEEVADISAWLATVLRSQS